jgi:predicted ATPase
MTTTVPRTQASFEAAAITTPDRRIRVFISSTLGELAEERLAAQRAITGLRQTPIMFETGARHHPARQLYRAYLAQSDIFVGIYWQNYGWVAPGENVSGLEDEYLLSGDRPKLIYVKTAGERQPRLTQLLDRLRADDQVAYKHFDSASELADLLADDLAVLLTESFAARRSAPSDLRAPLLPMSPTSIIGREDELVDIAALVTEPTVRLVTLVGSGGIGKTRLALELATRITALAQAPFDGVWFVDLTATGDPAKVLHGVAATLGIHQLGSASLIEVLTDRLEGRRVLLVLDNFEQVMAAAPVLAALLAACPGVTLLVTSRSVLRLRGEREVSLAPLTSPVRGETSDLDTIARSSAVQLFVLRGHEVRDTFVLTAANAQAVAELCRRLDGVPLALELAAAQLRLLTPQALLRLLVQRLDRSLDLGSGPVDLPTRQHTLRATIEWSHDLLAPAEQALLARLSVFVGAWNWESANAVGRVDGDADVLDTMSSLLAQSLIFPEEQGSDEPRFRMFDTVRAFAQERLEERGEYESTMARLAVFLQEFALAAGAGLEHSGNRRWTEQVGAAVPDLLNVMHHAVELDDAQTVVAMSAPLFTYWWSHGQLGQMRELAEQAAALPSAAQLSPQASALMLWGRGMFRISAGQSADAQPFLEQLLQAADALGDVRLRAHALAGLGVGAANTDVARARCLLTGSITSFRSQDDRWGLAFALSSGGLLALRVGEPGLAAELHLEGLQVATEIENFHLQAQLLDQLGFDSLAVGDIAGSRKRLVSAAAIHTQLLDQEGSAYCLDGLAALALSGGRAVVAAQLLAAAAHARSVLGVAVWPVMQPLAAAMSAAVAGALSSQQVSEASARGVRMRVPEALAWGLEQTVGPAESITQPATSLLNGQETSES